MLLTELLPGWRKREKKVAIHTCQKVDTPFSTQAVTANGCPIGNLLWPLGGPFHYSTPIVARETIDVICLGERIYVSLYGAAVDANVRLDKSTLRIDNTYISMANQRTITIHNRSDVLVHFKWSPFATKMEEDMQKERYCF